MRRCFNKMSFASRKLISNFRKKPKNLGAKEPSSWQYFFRFRPSPFRETAAFPAAQLIFKNFCQNLKFHLFFPPKNVLPSMERVLESAVLTYAWNQLEKLNNDVIKVLVETDRSMWTTLPTFLPINILFKHFITNRLRLVRPFQTILV